MDTPPQRGLTGPQRDRDAAIARIARARRVTILGAAALTAGLAGVISAVAPGRSFGAKASRHGVTAAASSRPVTAARMPRLDSPSQLGLQAPGSPPQAPQSAPPQQSQPAPVAPQPASSSGAVVSGGS